MIVYIIIIYCVKYVIVLTLMSLWACKAKLDLCSRIYCFSRQLVSTVYYGHVLYVFWHCKDVLDNGFSGAIIFYILVCQYSSPTATEGHKRNCPCKEPMSAPIHQATSEGKRHRLLPSDNSSSSNQEHKDDDTVETPALKPLGGLNRIAVLGDVEGMWTHIQFSKGNNHS